MKQVKVGFLSSHNYLDRNAWSGTLYQMYQALKMHNLKLVNLGIPSKPNYLKKLIRRTWTTHSQLPIGSPEYIKKNQKFAVFVEKQLKKTPCDVIFAPVGSKEITFLNTSIPIIYLSDITFKLYDGYYQSNFTPEEFGWRNKQETVAISKACKLVYPSEWAASSAIKDYKAQPEKIEIIPFGANIDNLPSFEEINLKSKTHSVCRLLFIGKDWQRKGGDIAFQTLVCLRERGIDAELTVIGSLPSSEIKHDKLTVIPFLDKNDPVQRQRFRELLLNSNYFIFPTRADCSPIVTCEANAFGLPVITTEVGGIPTIIRNGKNGYMLPLSASGEDFASLIEKIFIDQINYQNLVSSSRIEYEQRLNWQSWGTKMFQVISNL